MILFALRFSVVQTWIARQLSDWFSKKYGVTLHIEKVDIGLVSGIKLIGLHFLDHRQDTMLTAERLYIFPLEVRPWAGVLTLRRVQMEEGFFKLRRHAGDTQFNIEVLMKRLAPPDTVPDTLPAKPFLFAIHTIELKNFGFRMVEDGASPLPSAFQPGHIQVALSKALFRNFQVRGDSILARVDQLEAVDRSGAAIEAMYCDFGICSTALFFRQLFLKTPGGTELNGHVQFLYDHYSQFSDFLDSVRLDVALRPSRVVLKDVGRFAPLPPSWAGPIGIKLKAVGTVSRLNIEDFGLFLPAGTVFEGQMLLSGLPAIERLHLDGRIRRLHADFNQLPAFLQSWAGVTLPSWLQSLGETVIQGALTGQLNDFRFQGKCMSGWGGVEGNVVFSADSHFSHARYSASLMLNQLDLGHLPGVSILGRQSGRLEILGSGLRPKDLAVAVDVYLDQFTLNAYEYQQLRVKGRWEKMAFQGRVELEDRNAHLSFTGLLDLSKSVPYMACEVSIRNTDLQATGWLHEPFELEEVKISANASGDGPDNFLGRATAAPLRFCKNGRDFYYSELSFEADTALDGKRNFRLRSPYTDADFSGFFKFEELAHTVMGQLNTYLPSLRLPADTSMIQKNQQVDFLVELKQPEPLISPWIQNFSVAPGARLSGRFDGKNSMVLADFTAPGLVGSGVRLEGVTLRLSSNQRNFYIQLGLDRLYPSDSLAFLQVHSTVQAEKDSLTFDLNWSGDTEKLSHGQLRAHTSMSEPGSYSLVFRDSYVDLAGERWKLAQGARVTYDFSGFWFNDRFVFSSPTEANIGLNGKAGYQSRQVLRLLVNDFPLDYVNRFASPVKNLKLGGFVSGYVGIFSALKNPRMEADILVGQIQINQQDIGDLYLKSNFETETETAEVDAFLEFRRRRLLTLVGGRLETKASSQRMDLPLLVEDLPMKVLEIFTAPDFMNLQGRLNGFLQVQGSLNTPDFSGRFRLDEASGYMPVIGGRFQFYFSEGSFVTLNNKTIALPSIVLTDILGNKAFLTGHIDHDQFSDIRFNLNLDSRNQDFLFFNASQRESPEFYGPALAKGRIWLRGTPGHINVVASVTTSRGTRLFVSLEEGTQLASENNFVTFTTSRPESKERINKFNSKPQGEEEEVEATTIALTIEATVTPDAEINLVFNEATHDVLSAAGSGNLKLELTPTNDVFIFGDYEVVKGKYKFSLQNLLSKEMQLKPGGVITFSGDPTEARIQATAYYATRASPAPLLSASAGAEMQTLARNRVPVEVWVHLKGPILEPQVSFEVQFPTVGENTRAAYDAVLSTENEKNKQAFALLVLNQFLAPGTLGSSISGGGAVGSNSLEVISNQLSNLVSKISDDVDVGVRYRQGTKTGSGAGEVELALSTRLLDDRLIIDGNFGFVTKRPGTTASTTNAQNSGSIIDINIEYLLTQNGKFRIRAFNRSNYANLFSPFPYTQGAGLSYQTQFSAWRQLFFKKAQKSHHANPILDEDRPVE